MILDQNLKFDEFCDLLVKNSFKKWSILKKNCKYDNGITNKIERVQKRCTKFICFKFYENNSSYENRLKYLGLKSYKSRKDIRIVKRLINVRESKPNVMNEWLEIF
jgi:hypothetical protein